LSEGRLAEARRHAEEYVAIERAMGDRLHEAGGEHLLGRIAAEEGDGASAETHYRAALVILRGLELPDSITATLLERAEVRAEVRAEGGAPDAARADLQEALELARRHDLKRAETLACCRLATLPGGDPTEALATYARHEAHLENDARCEALYLLWRGTGDRAHIEAARELLEEALAPLDPDERARVSRMRLSRGILAAGP
jgi:hypothetical protein